MKPSCARASSVDGSRLPAFAFFSLSGLRSAAAAPSIASGGLHEHTNSAGGSERHCGGPYVPGGVKKF